MSQLDLYLLEPWSKVFWNNVQHSCNNNDNNTNKNSIYLQVKYIVE